MRDWGAKHIIAAVLMLVIGLAAGGVGPRAEVYALRERVDELEKRPCERGTGRQIANVFGGRPWEDNRANKRGVPPIKTGDPESDAPKDNKDNIEIHLGDDDDETPRDTTQDIALVKDALALRRAQAFAALREQASASDAQMTAVEAAVDNMNTNLKALAEEFVESIAEGQEPSRREVMLFAADTLDVLIEAEDSLYEALPEDKREQLDDAVLDPTSYVDSSVIDVFAALDR